MPVKLMKLPFEPAALEPAISAETIAVHHDKHHKAYVSKTNELVKDSELAGAPLEEIMRAADRDGQQTLLNQASQTWNHGFYWMSLSPQPTSPDKDLSDLISACFGSQSAMLEELTNACVDHFASGWAWLVVDGGNLSVETTHDAGCPILSGARPLLTIDVWEHAYYLDRKNDREAYVEAVLDRCLNWDFAARNLAREEAWTYPG
jgi:superoxide dismutase, Fe-Mn family